MNLDITTEDPFGILASTRGVVEHSRDVFIREDAVGAAAGLIGERFRRGLESAEVSFGTTTGSVADDVQLVFVEDVVNFCFWAGKDEPKWQIELPRGELTQGGWYGLTACFQRGLAERVPILDAEYLATISFADAKKFFRGAGGVEIPLLKERVQNFQEAGQILLEKFAGEFINALEQADFDAIGIGNMLIEHFKSFRDVSMLEGTEVVFLKRAQICPNDLQYVLNGRGKKITNVNQLTAFADYKLPQVLRMFGVLTYRPELAKKIDTYVELPHDSREEVEIRAATIWAVELLRQHLPHLSAGDIDNTLWVMSQDIQEHAKPYHRTRTIFY